MSVKYYSLNEFNIFREEEDLFILKAVNGLEMELDKMGSIFFLALAGEEVEKFPANWEKYGVKDPYKETIEELTDCGFIEILEGEPIIPFNREIAIKNLDRIKNGPVTLQELSITLSDSCPLKCTYCFRKENNVRGKLDDKTVESILKEFAELAGSTLNISGGEPSVFSKDVIHCARVATEYGIENISVNTSGININKEMLKEWKEAGISCINLSLDTLDKEKSEKLIGSTKGIDKAMECIEEARKLDLFVHINLTLLEENYKEIKDFGVLLETGKIEMRVNPYVPLSSKDQTDPHLVKKAHEIVEEMRKEGFPIYTPIDLEEEFPEKFICSGGLTRATIENNGKLGGCQFLMNKFGPEASIFEYSLTELWTEGGFDIFREGLLAPPPDCEECRYRPYCVSSCVAFHEGLLKNDIYCPLKKGVKNEDN